MKYKIKTKEKVNMLQRPSSLKQMNFKMECFSSLLVTINTEVIELKSNLKLTNLCRLDEWQLSATILCSSLKKCECYRDAKKLTKNYADEMLFKTDNVCQKVDAKNKC